MDTTGILIAHWNGRFGNRMHQYAYAAQYAERFGIDCVLPSEWEGTRLFERQRHKIVGDNELRLLLNQSQPFYDTLEARTCAIEAFNARTGSRYELIDPHDSRVNWAGKCSVFIDSICSYHRTIFEQMSSHCLKNELFVFSDEVRETRAYQEYSDRQGTYDVAHLRRDDVANAVNNRHGVQGYSVLSRESYFRAFEQYGYDPASIEWVSDDYSGKWHVDRPEEVRGGWSYPVGSQYLGPERIFDWLADFLKLYFARTIFRANSSFSWWASFLSPTATTFSPVLHRQVIYGRDSLEEVDYEFVEGNHPHWMYGCDDIHFSEELEPARSRWWRR